jgi:hypothetical protein
LIELPPFEVLLPLGALAFYAYDCCLMLFDDETVQHWTGTAWLPQRPTSVVLMRKRLLLLDLLRPDRMSLRTATEPVDLSAPPEALMQAVRPLQIGVQLLAVLLWVVLPTVSLALGAGLALLAVFAAYYAGVVALLVITANRRVALGLSTKTYWAIALDCILCPPFAVNLVRKITLQATHTHSTP